MKKPSEVKRMRGSEEQFNIILNELANINRSYDQQAIKFAGWVDQKEKLYAAYGWDKIEFLKELDKRIKTMGKEPNSRVIR